MKLSARNVFKGVVKSMEIGAVNAEVVIEIAAGLQITSIVTKKSCQNLGLEAGKEAFVIIKASNVMIGVE